MFQEDNGNIEIRDHPRIRGTNVFIPWVLSKLEGSSPHTRDKLGAKYKIIGQLRIIPAYAGQMEITPSSSRENSDHPRIRGTNVMKYAFFPFPTGSSPHTRDKLEIRCAGATKQRIIPAYAGQMKRAKNTNERP